MQEQVSRTSQAPNNWPPCKGRSDILRETNVQNVQNASSIRSHYIENWQETQPPWVSSSSFAPVWLVEHLMRDKKDSALGVKFEPHATPPDSITNMEGAMHTFVTPIVFATIHGDYYYENEHRVRPFGSADGYLLGRDVLISAMVHPDFENRSVMFAACLLGDTVTHGLTLPHDANILDLKSNQSAYVRRDYDLSVRQHFIAHLTSARHLPAAVEVAAEATSIDEAKKFLENLIVSFHEDQTLPSIPFLRLRCGGVLSMEMLLNSAKHQVVNELLCLEAICPQGYVYTYDPPAIFATQLDPLLLTRLYLFALKQHSSTTDLTNMRVFAFNNYADQWALELTCAALQAQAHVLVCTKAELFRNDFYEPPRCAVGSLLVLHNNSDGFGQNIETEEGASSMDAAIGQYSSAAASLLRSRTDLLSLSRQNGPAH